jgi:hypothetical protein
MSRTETADKDAPPVVARYGLRRANGEWLTRPELVPLDGIGTTDKAKRRGWAWDSTARRFLTRHPEMRRAGFKVCPIDD